MGLAALLAGVRLAEGVLPTVSSPPPVTRGGWYLNTRSFLPSGHHWGRDLKQRPQTRSPLGCSLHRGPAPQSHAGTSFGSALSAVLLDEWGQGPGGWRLC